MKDWVYWPNCASPHISQFPANNSVADFFLSSCSEEYELKGHKTAFGTKVVDGAFEHDNRTARGKRQSQSVASRAQPSIVNAFVVPKHFFVQEAVEKRRPLASTARRAGWVGGNILLKDEPPVGKTYIVQDGVPVSKDHVLARWQRTLFLREQGTGARS